MQLNETIFSKSIVLKTKEIYPLSLDILDTMDAFGLITEKKHEFETTGPRRRVHINFDMEDVFDRHSSAIFSFIINGESNDEGFLDVGVKGILTINEPQIMGIGSLAFNTFYSEHILPMLKKDIENKIDKMGRFIEKKIEGLNFKYT